jgi:hypothetical protein
MGLQLLAIEQAHRIVAVIAAKLVEPRGKLVQMPRLGRDVHMVWAIIALDAVALDERLIEIERLHRHLEQPFRVLAAELGRERLLAGCEPENSLAAAAARGAVSDEIRLEQGDLESALRQVQCRRASRKPAPDDGDVRVELSGERRARGLQARRARGAVIGRRRWLAEAHGDDSVR